MASVPVHTWNDIEVKAEFETLYNKCVDAGESEEAEIVKSMYDMIDKLKADGGAYVTDLHPRFVGIHPSNRSGKKMSGRAFQKKGNKVCKGGFSLRLCSKDKAIAVEANGKDVEEHTMWIVAGQPEFGKYNLNEIRVGSCGCSHLNQYLLAVSSNAKCVDPAFCEPGTDKFNIRIRRPTNADLAHALEKGLEWTVIKASVARAYPAFPGMLQRALNVEHHIGEGDRSYHLYRYMVTHTDTSI